MRALSGSDSSPTQQRAGPIACTKLPENVRSSLNALIGASLSEPHTSVTSLHTCVCMLACLLAWTDHISKSARIFNITEIELVAIARVQRRLQISK